MVVNIYSWKKMAVIKILLLAAFLLVACSSDTTSLVKGQPTPGFFLQNLQGNTIHFPDHFQQKVVLISFWADWCSSCKKEMHDFEFIFQKYRNQGFAVIAINIAQERDKAVAFIDDLDLSYEVLLDVDGKVTKDYAVSSIPSVFILNKDGNLHTRILGESPPEIFEQVLRSLL